MSCSGDNCNGTEYPISGAEFRSDTGRFGLCQGVWNKEENKFEPATETDVEWCCLNICKSSADACLQQCVKDYGPDSKSGNFQDYTECKNNCGRIILSCENTCALSGPDIWRGKSPIISCIEQSGCGKYPVYDKDCIKRNKDDLLTCCNKGCIPNSGLSCLHHCKRKYDDFIGESKDPLLITYNKYNFITPGMYNKNVVSTDDNSWKYYLMTVGIVVILLGLLLFFWRIKK